MHDGKFGVGGGGGVFRRLGGLSVAGDFLAAPCTGFLFPPPRAQALIAGTRMGAPPDFVGMLDRRRSYQKR